MLNSIVKHNVFIINDTVYLIVPAIKTDHGSSVFEHTDMYFKEVFRMLTLILIFHKNCAKQLKRFENKAFSPNSF